MMRRGYVNALDIERIRDEVLSRGYTIVDDAVDKSAIDEMRTYWIDRFNSSSSPQPVIWGPYYGEENRIIWDHSPTHAMHRSYDFLWNAPMHTVTREIGLSLSRMRNRIAEHDERAGELFQTDRYGIYITTSYYPAGSGWLEQHQDEAAPGKRHWHFILPMTFRGTDYADGGLFLIDRNGDKVDVDLNMRPGSVIFFDGTCPHGVDRIQPLPGSTVGRLQMFAIPAYFELPHEHDRILENVSVSRYLKARLRKVRNRFRAGHS